MQIHLSLFQNQFSKALTYLNFLLGRMKKRQPPSKPVIQALSGKNHNSAPYHRVYGWNSLQYIARYLKSSYSIYTYSVNLFNSFSTTMDMLIISNRVLFSNINFWNMILFSQLTAFGKLSFFNFGLLYLSLDAFQSLWCIWCKLIFLGLGLLSNVLHGCSFYNSPRPPFHCGVMGFMSGIQM